MTHHDHTVTPVQTGDLDLQRVGRRRFIAGAGAVAGASAVGSLLPQGSAHAALPPGASNFFSLPKGVRVADTRFPKKYDFRTFSNKHIRVKIAGRVGVPPNATAAVLTLAAVNFGALNHCTVYEAGQPVPEAANLNLAPGAINANMVTVKIGANGSIDVSSFGPCHKIVDVLGYYAPVSGEVRQGRFVSLDSPRRVFDSRPKLVANESYTTIDVTAVTPLDAESVVINLAAAGCTAAGHFTAMPYSASGPPSTSSLNASGPGDIRSAGVVVPITKVGSKRLFKVYAHRSAFIIVDVFGYFTSTGSSLSNVGLFVPMTPLRIMDTRWPNSIGKMWPKWVVEVPLPKSIRDGASAIACNVTGVLSRSAGHLTCSAARRQIPNTANVNWTTGGAIVPNHVMTTVTNTYGMQVFNLSGGHVVVDLAGYYTGTAKIPRLAKYDNPPPPAAPPSWTMSVPRLGLVSAVIAGDPNAITDAGHSWHWTGTGYMGQVAHVSVFGHRTEAGGPYRRIHELQPGDGMTIVTGDRREFTYRMVRRDLVTGPNKSGPPTSAILDATRRHPGTTFSLIACTRTDLLPTSLNHRLVVTFELVSWKEF